MCRRLLPAALILCAAGIVPGLPGTGPAAAHARAEQDPVIPPDAQRKAVLALQALGPSRGARAITSRSVAILGVSAAVSASRVEVIKSLKDLGAKETQTDYRIELPGDVLFDFDKWAILPDAEETLKKVAAVIKSLKSPRVAIAGHTDSKGSEDYNQILSENRAAAVRDWLVQKGGVDTGLLTAVGYGEKQPAATNVKGDGSDDPEGRRKNRRVEIVIKKS